MIFLSLFIIAVLLGKFMGKAIIDGQLLDAHFTIPFYKHILGLPVTFYDLENYDEIYYKSLMLMLTTSLEDLDLTDMTFSIDTLMFNEQSELKESKEVNTVTIDLIENGRNVIVTNENKAEYIRLLAHHRLSSSFRKQTDSFLKGFHSIIPADLISIFDSTELELLICGLPDIDIDDLYKHTSYHGYRVNDPTIIYFWNVIRSLSKEELAQFLQFVTGTSKVSVIHSLIDCFYCGLTVI